MRISGRRINRWANFDPERGMAPTPKRRGLFCPSCNSNHLKLYDAMHGLRWYRCMNCGQRIMYDKTDPIRQTSSYLTGKDGKIKPYSEKVFKQGLITLPHLDKLK